MDRGLTLCSKAVKAVLVLVQGCGHDPESIYAVGIGDDRRVAVAVIYILGKLQVGVAVIVRPELDLHCVCLEHPHEEGVNVLIPDCVYLIVQSSVKYAGVVPDSGILEVRPIAVW